MSREVPQGWTLQPLADLANYINGRAFKPEDWVSSGLPIIRIVNMTNSDAAFNFYEGKDVDDGHMIQDGDILFSWSATLSIQKWTRGAGVLNQHIFKVVPTGAVQPDWLLYVLQNEVERLADQSHGSTMKHIKKGVLKTHHVGVPPLHEQRRIAEILSSVDEAITATRAVIKQTRKVNQGALERLVTKGICHTRFKHTEIGKIPEGWEVVTLFDALREPVRNGYSPVSPPSPTGGWLLSLGSLSNDGLTGENLKPAPLDDPRMGAAKLSCGDVLISRSNTPDRVGMVGIYKGQPSNCFFPDLMICLRFRESLINADFGALWLRHLQATGYFKRAAAGTSASMVKINRGLLSQIRIAVPSIGEQKAIVNKINDIQLTIGAVEDELRAAVSMKVALMTDLLTGCKRVTDALPMAAE
ncbi:restriction endonuclease subunit S [Agrobacterium tumefaciens]|jgi:type I restriction enzyme S subunit|uniref:restriction endonuclease subunit S n=1 Tax=Agrobacterium tumefaciens TaxID=358 RepID=UPI0039A414F4